MKIIGDGSDGRAQFLHFKEKKRKSSHEDRSKQAMQQVLSASENITPRSVLRYRPLGTPTSTIEKVSARQSVATSATTATRSSRVRPRSADVDEVVVEWRRAEMEPEKNAKNIRNAQTQSTFRPAPEAAKHAPETPAQPAPAETQPSSKTAQPSSITNRRKHATHPLVYLGMGMIAMLIAWMLISSIGSWFMTTLDDLHYGRPRTFQTDYRVGHNDQTGDPSHFIALNLNRHIQVIEISGGDATHTHIYVGPQLYGPNDDLVPVTLTFLDVNGDQKPDMLINFQGTHVVFINDQGSFRAVQTAEHDHVEQFLVQHNLGS